MDWAGLRAAKEAELGHLASPRLSEVTPSIRDFSQFVTTHKQELALIPALKRRDPDTGTSWPQLDLCELARACDACDEVEVGAIGVYTETSLFGASYDDLRAVSDVVGAPLLALDLALHEHQVYSSRLYGADAVLLWGGSVDHATLEGLMVAAASVHVVPLVMAHTPHQVDQALAAGAWVVGLASPVGTFDAGHIAALAAHVPPRQTCVCLDEIATAQDAASLSGVVDAVLVSQRVLDTADVAGALARLRGA